MSKDVLLNLKKWNVGQLLQFSAIFLYCVNTTFYPKEDMVGNIILRGTISYHEGTGLKYTETRLFNFLLVYNHTVTFHNFQYMYVLVNTYKNLKHVCQWQLPSYKRVAVRTRLIDSLMVNVDSLCAYTIHILQTADKSSILGNSTPLMYFPLRRSANLTMPTYYSNDTAHSQQFS